MSFQAYLDNIEAKTGYKPQDFKKQMEEQGLLSSDLKAGELVNWLKSTHDLGHGHSMAIWAVFKSEGWVNDQKKKK